MKKLSKLLSLLLSASLASQMISGVNINATKDSITFYDVKNNILDLKAYDAELDTNHDGNMNVFDVIRANKTLIQEESYTDLKEKVYMLETQIESLYQKLNEKTDAEEGKQLSSNDYTDEEKQKLESLNNYDDTKIKTDISDLSGSLTSKVDKEEGKQLSSNDYTDEEKQKLESLNNYDDTKLNEKIDSLVQTAYEEKKEIESSIDNKVNKEEGKQLSSNDYTDEEKQKLESLNNYDDTEIKKYINNKYEGLKGVAFGTSLTYRAETTGGYLQYLPDLLEMEFDNQGIGGATIYPITGDGIIYNKITSYSNYSNKDICILEGFVDDWYYESPLGEYTDNDDSSVCGRVRKAINYIMSQNRNITIFLVLDHYGRLYNSTDESSSAVRGGITQYEYYEEISKVAESLGVPVVKQYAISRINENTPQYFLDDIHMNSLGAKQSANTIYSVMIQYIPNEKNKIIDSYTHSNSTVSANEIVNKPKEAIFSIIDDDSDFDGIATIKSICEEKGVKPTYGVIYTSLKRNEDLLNRLKDYQKEGCSIVSHPDFQQSKWHPDSADYDIAFCEATIVDSIDYLSSNGFLDCEHFISPGGANGAELRNIASKWCKSACTNNSATSNHLYEDRYDLRRTFIGGATLEEYYKPIIDNAYENGDWIIFGTHSGDIASTEGLSELISEVLDYAISKGLKFKPYTQVIKERTVIYDSQELM